MKERLSRLLTVKSLVTLSLTVVFAYLSVVSKITADQFMTVFVTIIAFYFGTQVDKSKKEGN